MLKAENNSMKVWWIMQEKTIKELRQELKEQIKENQELIAEIKELNVDNEWWNNT